MSGFWRGRAVRYAERMASPAVGTTRALRHVAGHWQRWAWLTQAISPVASPATCRRRTKVSSGGGCLHDEDECPLEMLESSWGVTATLVTAHALGPAPGGHCLLRSGMLGLIVIRPAVATWRGPRIPPWRSQGNICQAEGMGSKDANASARAQKALRELNTRGLARWHKSIPAHAASEGRVHTRS